MRGRPPLRRGALPPAPPLPGSAAVLAGLVPLLLGDAAADPCCWLLGAGLADDRGCWARAAGCRAGRAADGGCSMQGHASKGASRASSPASVRSSRGRASSAAELAAIRSRPLHQGSVSAAAVAAAAAVGPQPCIVCCCCCRAAAVDAPPCFKLRLCCQPVGETGLKSEPRQAGG